GKSELTAREFLRAAEAQMDYLQKSLHKTRELKVNNERSISELSGHLKEALGELTITLLPGLDSTAFDRAARITDYLNLRTDFPASRLDSMKRESEARVAEIEANPVYKKPAPIAERREAELALKPAEDLIARADSEKHLDKLIEIGY